VRLLVTGSAGYIGSVVNAGSIFAGENYDGTGLSLFHRATTRKETSDS
jgi:UDP-glucose 4-epimerase